jgi:hypothetical protein
MTKATYSNITVYAPLQSSYGFLPASKWPDFMPSLIWTAMTDKGSRVVTWEGARLDRDVTQPVSFQAEFHENGEVAYRYDMFPTNDVDTPGVPTYFLTAFPSGTYFFLRQNFVQYAVFSNKRCSNDFYWFSRTTLSRILFNDHYSFEFLNRADHPYDNAVGEGSTDITW